MEFTSKNRRRCVHIVKVRAYRQRNPGVLLPRYQTATCIVDYRNKFYIKTQ